MTLHNTKQMDNKAIAVKNLVKSFNSRKQIEEIIAVDDISFSINKGEIFGLLGSNGAGKTTTINILCGLLQATDGESYVGGLDTINNIDQIKQIIGVCPQKAAVYKHLTAKENIELFGNLHLMNKKILKERTSDLIELLGLEKAANRKTKEYSGGMLRQLNLIIALINDPPIIFLDEPTVGMDARVRRTTWQFIQSLKDGEKTIILTTHYIEEAESLCDRVAIMDFGKIVALGTPKELMEKYDVNSLEKVFLETTGHKILEGI